MLDVFWTLVESGALYALTTVLVVGFYGSNKISGVIVEAALGQISVSAHDPADCCVLSSHIHKAIAPTLIIVRAGLRDSEPAHFMSSIRTSMFGNRYQMQKAQGFESSAEEAVVANATKFADGGTSFDGVVKSAPPFIGNFR